MSRLKLDNLKSLEFGGYRDYFDSFTVKGYTFSSAYQRERAPYTHRTHADRMRQIRKHEQNAFIEFFGTQENSILFKNGKVGTTDIGGRIQKRKIIDDILVLGSLLTGFNWSLYSRRKYPNYPLVPNNGLKKVSYTNTLGADLTLLLQRIKDPQWQAQFDNGFHLIMFLNASNIRIKEWRFLSEIVIWEFIYAKLNPVESENLNLVIKEILKHYWPTETQNIDTLFHNRGQNIFCVLRNQLAHSGKLPINRTYAETWMRNIPPYATEVPQITLDDYMNFFDELTHVVVMKTLGFNIERQGDFNGVAFPMRLSNFFTTGQ